MWSTGREEECETEMGDHSKVGGEPEKQREVGWVAAG